MAMVVLVLLLMMIGMSRCHRPGRQQQRDRDGGRKADSDDVVVDGGDDDDPHVGGADIADDLGRSGVAALA